MNLTFIGAGYVGLTTAAVFANQGHKVCILDVDSRKIRNIKNKTLPFFEEGLEAIVSKTIENRSLIPSTSYESFIPNSNVIFICVGTPSKNRSGETDLSYLFSAAKSVANNLGDKYTVVVVKSTVPPGTTNRVGEIIAKTSKKRKGIDFDVANSPEFLAEGSALKDTLSPSRIVVGVNSKKTVSVLKDLFKSFGAPIQICDLQSSELIKYASNAFLATKISYINEIALIAEMVGADVSEVAKGMGFDDRIGPKFLKAGLGFGGSCFPKDVEALLSFSNHSGYEFGVLRAANNVNLRQHRKFVEKMIQKLGGLRDKKVAVLGLAFKPNTDDMRKAVSIEIIISLLKKGASVSAYDPLAISNAEKVFSKKRVKKDKLSFTKDIYSAIDGADCLVLVTEWEEFTNMDWYKIKKLMRGNLVADGRNIFNSKTLRKFGFDYFGVGVK